MPELPEVEVVKRSLTSIVKNLTVKNVKIKDVKLRYKIDKKKILELKGLKLLKIKRRSKFLIFYFKNQKLMLVHLGMTGKFFFIEKDNNYKTSFYYNLDYQKDRKHDRVTFFFNNKRKLIYNDIRKFGFIKFFKNNEIANNFHLANLGPEPLDKDFNFYYLKNYLSGRNRNIKSILMDQKCVSGLGNIYVNEILFLSKVKPFKLVKKLKNEQIKDIVYFTKKILSQAIRLGGSSIKDFSSGEGERGEFQQFFNVYNKKGLKCSNADCNKKIIRVVISNRSTFYCGRCQK